MKKVRDRRRKSLYECVPFGAVAQLGERMHGMHEVTGSIPVGSTYFPVFVGCFGSETPKWIRNSL
jgi:hypothetical protein